MEKEQMNIEIEPGMEKRISRADSYDQRTGNQKQWYSKNATKNKKIFQSIGILIVAFGAFVGIVPLLFGTSSEPTTAEIITAILGALIVMLKGVERIWLPEEKWQNYRKASEALKREKESYIEGISPYNRDMGEDENYLLYVKRCVLIKAEEQNNFWGLSGETKQENVAPDLKEEKNKK